MRKRGFAFLLALMLGLLCSFAVADTEALDTEIDTFLKRYKTAGAAVLVAKDGEVVYFHCHGGSDRTGTLAFLIEALMGVSENDLSKDYEVTYYSGSKRKRNGESGWYFGPMVRYLRTFAPGRTIQEQVTAWATTGENALTLEEIEKLKALLLE